jgi:NAD(P)-dependent dehydrogenase (short-subunit alcohol dehydrogenase family)
MNPMGACHGEMVQISDVTGVISFLVGPDAKFITGQTIVIDGGYSIQ